MVAARGLRAPDYDTLIMEELNAGGHANLRNPRLEIRESLRVDYLLSQLEIDPIQRIYTGMHAMHLLSALKESRDASDRMLSPSGTTINLPTSKS